MSPKVLSYEDVDVQADELDAVMTEAEEIAVRQQFARTPPGQVPDLTDGGMVNGVRLYPVQGGIRQERGRAVARRAWSWNGTESLLPLAWDPDGKIHDNARHYLAKRHCTCCGTAGFIKLQGRPLVCPSCAKTSCTRCASGTSLAPQVLPSGKVNRGFIIANFYVRKEDAPFQTRFYGDVDCMIESCPRRGDRGFKTEEDMRVHAMGIHTMEYQAKMASLAASGNRETESLRAMVNELMAQVLRLSAGPPLPPGAVQVAAVPSVPVFPAKAKKPRTAAQIAATARWRASQKATNEKRRAEKMAVNSG